MTDEQYMRRAIDTARKGILAGQSPFGSVIVRGGEVVAAAHNTVWRDTDPTAHAEMNNIRAAAAALQTIDLGGCTLVATCEPCPMCLVAIHWTKIERVVFGASIADAAAAGFSQVPIGAAALATLAGSPLRIEADLLAGECRALFALWKDSRRSDAY